MRPILRSVVQLAGAVAAVALLVAGQVVIPSPARAAPANIVVVPAGQSPCASGTTTVNSVQAGVDAATAGDTVLLCQGDYREQVTVYNKGEITVRSADASRAGVILAPTVMRSAFGGRPSVVSIGGRSTLSWAPRSRWPTAPSES